MDSPVRNGRTLPLKHRPELHLGPNKVDVFAVEAAEGVEPLADGLVDTLDGEGEVRVIGGVGEILLEVIELLACMTGN